MLDRFISKQIIEDLDFFPIVGIIGPRQVGKTTLAKHVLNKANLSANSIYVDLESSQDKRKMQDAESYLTYHKNSCVIIDEIQLMPHLFSLLRSLVDKDRRAGRFIILGSASPAIIKNSSETLAGRIVYNELMPFSWLEARGEVLMKHHWLFGGFPQPMLAKKSSQSQRWLTSFTQTLIQRDLPELNLQISPELIEKILIMLAGINGQILNQSNLSRSLGVSQPTINRYLDILEGAFIIKRLQPYFINVSKRLVKQPKVYIRDSGILHCLLGINNLEQLLGNTIVGASWEGYVIEQIVRITENKVKTYFYKTHKGAECDLVVVMPSGKKICIEIKKSASQGVSRGFYETIKDIKPEKSFVIFEQGESYPLHNKTKDEIWFYNLDEFLQKVLVLLTKVEI